MPSYGRYRRGYRYSNRSRYRRYKRTFSKYNTYRNRSSVSQANQIYKLNKRISKIESNTKPEYLEFMPPTAGSPIAALTNITKWSSLTLLHVTDIVGDNQFGDIMKNTSSRVFKIIVWGALERNPAILPENVDKHDLAMSCGYVRLAVMQYAAEKYADISADSIFDMNSGPSGFYHPLKRGCGSYGRILRIFNIKISSQDPTTKPFKFIIKPKYKIVCKSFDDEIDNVPISNQRMKGGIVVIPIGYVESNNITHSDTFHFSMSAKAIYTDA